jgi:hypothetical protein
MYIRRKLTKSALRPALPLRTEANAINKNVNASAAGNSVPQACYVCAYFATLLQCQSWEARMRKFTLLLATAFLVIGAGPLAADTIYTYDELGRLSKVCYDNGKQLVYTYDQAGNRTQVVTQGTCS